MISVNDVSFRNKKIKVHFDDFFVQGANGLKPSAGQSYAISARIMSESVESQVRKSLYDK